MFYPFTKRKAGRKRRNLLNELTLDLPVGYADKHSSYTSVHIDQFPYYLKTDDFVDFIRLVVYQKEYREAIKWSKEHSATEQTPGEHADLDEVDKVLPSMKLTQYIQANRWLYL